MESNLKYQRLPVGSILGTIVRIKRRLRRSQFHFFFFLSVLLTGAYIHTCTVHHVHTLRVRKRRLMYFNIYFSNDIFDNLRISIDVYIRK